MRQGNGSDILDNNDPRSESIGIIYMNPIDDRKSVLAALIAQDKLQRKQVAIVLPPGQNKAFQRPGDFDDLEVLRSKLQTKIVFIAPSGLGPAEFARRRRFNVYSSLESYAKALREDQSLGGNNKDDQTTIYLSPEDDLSLARERLEKTPNRNITLVIPTQTLLRSHVAWKILYARAKELKKNVLIVSADAQIRSVAQAVKFRVASSLEKAYPQPTTGPSITPVKRVAKPIEPKPIQDTNIGKHYANYSLLSLIGSGELGSVYLGEHIQSHEKAAIKLIRWPDTKEALQYVQKIAQLQHPNIVRIFDTGMQDATLYLAMEYIPNSTIQQHHPKGTVVPLTTVVSYVKQLAKALQHAHRNSILHQHLKPEEIFVGNNSTILLGGLDTRLIELNDDARLPPADFFAYMSPEQILGKSQPSSDLYSLAIIVYEWLTGSLPFEGDLEPLLVQRMRIPPSPLRSKDPSIPQAVEDVVLKALAKEPKDRFESVMAFAEALERASQPPKPKFQPNNALGLQFGSYRLLQHLSSGPFGDVYLAEHVSLGSRAAIKVLHRGMDVEQFRRGVRRIARLNHPNIVRVIDSGIKDTIPFLVMDFASRGSLHDLHHYSQEQPLPLTTVVAYVKQAAAALQELHDYNIVPTLINPHDLLIGDNNEILFDSIDIALTSNEKELPAGNPGYYVAPEQMSGPTFPESNQYALALMAYEWLSGHKLTGNTIMPGILPGSKPLAPLHTLVPNIPQEVSDVIMKALSKEPKDRYSTIEDFANALEDASLPKEQTKTRVGQQFGKYRLIKRLGRGGFADVYQGRHVEMDTFAAIKVLHSQVYDQDEKRFLEEARTIASLRHPNIIRVLDFGIEDETPYLVMDQANGTLRDRHPKGSLLPARTILPYIKQVAAALQYAHDQRRIHRDIKPENMLIGGRNAILLSDFGLATTVNTATYQHTKTIAGTAIYTAPEQFRGRAGFASDQYALGIVVYEWLCGTAPFTDGDFMQLGYQHGYEPIPSMREKIPSLSPDTERVVMIALAKDPKQRFATIQAFANAFAQACG